MMFLFRNIFFIITLVSCSVLFVSSRQPSHDYPTTLWINKTTNKFTLDDASGVETILVRGSSFGPEYACGFYCNGDCHSYVFAISILPTNDTESSRVIVWSSNPVEIFATLQLTADGDLVLRDADGALAWSTNTAGKGVAGLNLTELGNLVLFGANNSTVWQSFDHPIDCLLPGQTLVSGKNLTASNWTEGGLFSVSMTDIGLEASILSDPLLVYGKLFVNLRRNREANSYAKFNNGSLALYVNVNESQIPDYAITFPLATSAQYMKLGDDGHLRVFMWLDQWKEVADIFKRIGDCGYPLVCQNYGICSNGSTNGQCSCPNEASFSPVSERRPDLGCVEVIPLTCNDSENYMFLDLDNNITYFAFTHDFDGTMNSCKQKCLDNCSCKAVIFRSFNSSSLIGQCYMPSQIFSLMEYDRANSIYNDSVSIKVVHFARNETNTTIMEGTTPTAAKGDSGLSWLKPLLGSSAGVICIAAAIGATVFVCKRRRRRKPEEVEEEDDFGQVPGMPTRFSFQELVTATNNFEEKLGEGGFGSVFEGSLNDGTRIAVKRLDGVGHIKKSFLAEVQTIGSIHHINLVRLIGFCAEKSHRLLVYEYMCNGSLDKWIYCRSRATSLDWSHKRKIILDIAKGLTYLHEDCRQKIIHLDIKPQNILLDEHYNAKLADFGLSKLIERDQIEVVTTMRGTPGYLAPEWLHAVITEKVDVYSFGVVILEILCGRKIFEQSRGEGERYLLTLFKKKAEEGQWLDLVDKCCLEVESNVGEVEEMLQISAWCLQSDYEKRPPMSMVIKVLERVKDVPKDVDYNFVVPQYMISKVAEVSSQEVSAILPSALSGPR